MNAVRQVYVDKGNCTSCGLCAETHPHYFRMDPDDLAESHNRGANPNAATVFDEHRRLVQVAINDCPGECIHWRSRVITEASGEHAKACEAGC
jgi:ferredoxin